MEDDLFEEKAETQLELWQISNMELFAEIANKFPLLPIFRKSYI